MNIDDLVLFNQKTIMIFSVKYLMSSFFKKDFPQ